MREIKPRVEEFKQRKVQEKIQQGKTPQEANEEALKEAKEFVLLHYGPYSKDQRAA
jgi:hypothetical protein